MQREYRQRKAEAKKQIRDMQTEGRERELAMRKMRRRVLHSRGKVHKAGTELSMARLHQAKDVRTDFEQLAAMPSSQMARARTNKAKTKSTRSAVAAGTGFNPLQPSMKHGTQAPAFLKAAERSRSSRSMTSVSTV